MIALQRKGVPDTAIASYLHISPQEFASTEGALRQAITEASGKNTDVRSLSSALQLPYPLVLALAEHYHADLPIWVHATTHLPLKRKIRKSERTLRKIQAAIKKGMYMPDIARKSEVSPSTVRAAIEHHHLCSLKDVQIPPTKKYYKKFMQDCQEYPSMSSFALKGYSLNEIKRQEKISRERASQMIEDAGIYYFWRIRRAEVNYQKYQERENETQAHQQLFSILVARSQQLLSSLQEKDWPIRKTIEYILQRKREGKISASLQKILRLFTSYQKADTRGETLSCEALAERSGISNGGQVWRILEAVHLKPFHTKRKAYPVSTDVRNRFQESRSLGMGNKDIAYFSKYPSSTVIRCRKGGHAIFVIGYKGREFGLTCSLASQIYDLYYHKTSKKDIQELLGIQKEALEYALTHRTEIEKEIKTALRLFHPNQEITKPYLKNNQG